MDSAEIDVRQDDDSNSYVPVVKYHYFVNGQRYEGNRFWFAVMNHTDREELSVLMEPYKPGREVKVYYDPDLPFNSVLVLNSNLGWFPIMLSLFFIGIPAFMIFFIIIAARSRDSNGRRLAQRAQKLQALADVTPMNLRSDSSSPAGQTTQGFISECCPQEIDDVHGDKPFILTSTTHRVGAFLGILFFALIWNGVTYAILFAVLSEDKLEWFAVVFLTPFVLIGLGVIVALVYSLLKIFNPKPAVVCSNSLLYPGSEFELSWTFSGRSSSLKAVKLSLLVSKLFLTVKEPQREPRLTSSFVKS